MYKYDNDGEIKIPVNTEKYRDLTLSFVFELDGNECGIDGDIYFKII